MANVIIEGIVACFIVLIACVVGIANGPVNMVCLYEQEVQKRVIEKGLITEEKIKHNADLFRLFGMMPLIIFIVVAVYGVNGARGFGEGFWQMTVIALMEGLFDRLFIDYYWVGKTKAGDIEGTEDLKPYIYGKSLAVKWLSTVVGYPLITALIALIMSFILK
ncbi:MAG: hypothetical protein IJ779_05260 [Ruminococcus sp.]|nr:hypothetical protein [Ruminococcus sp.]